MNRDEATRPAIKALWVLLLILMVILFKFWGDQARLNCEKQFPDNPIKIAECVQELER